MSATTAKNGQNGEAIDSTAVEVYQGQAPPPSLFHTDDPVEVIERATKVANALKSVVAKQGLITRIQGREHPRVEAWQTLGSMLGVFPVKEWVRKIAWPEPVPEPLKALHARGLAFGYEASFVAQRPDGAIVGGGEAACMRTESTWSTRDDYALRSMAQTRATSKALSAPLRFIMALAGYETTAAEEMPSEPTFPSTAAVQPSARPAAQSERPATAKQRNLILARAQGLDAVILANILLTAAGDPPRVWEEEAAERWVKRALDRLPARLVDPVLEGIKAAGEGGR